ncbi:MAG: hypothetical protein JO363_22475 [Solirubrobacterales bacterium]|nr:hypothetical protein [Solirubrobacterales bacterium]
MPISIQAQAGTPEPFSALELGATVVVWLMVVVWDGLVAVDVTVLVSVVAGWVAVVVVVSV